MLAHRKYVMRYFKCNAKNLNLSVDVLMAQEKLSSRMSGQDYMTRKALWKRATTMKRKRKSKIPRKASKRMMMIVVPAAASFLLINSSVMRKKNPMTTFTLGPGRTPSRILKKR